MMILTGILGINNNKYYRFCNVKYMYYVRTENQFLSAHVIIIKKRGWIIIHNEIITTMID